VIFVCENNFLHGIYADRQVTAVPHPAADRAAAYGLERIVIDGNDADIVYRTAAAPMRRRVPGLVPRSSNA